MPIEDLQIKVPKPLARRHTEAEQKAFIDGMKHAARNGYSMDDIEHAERILRGTDDN